MVRNPKSIVIFTEASGHCPEQIKRVQNLILSISKSSFNIIRPSTLRSFRVFRQKFPVLMQSPMSTTCPRHLIIFFSWRSSPIQVWATLLLRFLDYTRTHTNVSIPLNECSARRRIHYLHNTQQTLKTNIYALSGIQTRLPSTRAATDLRLRPHGHRHRPS